MIKDDMTPYKLKVTFMDAGVKRAKYTDDRRYYDHLISKHGHLSGLEVEPLTLTLNQDARLNEIKSAGLDAHDAGVYVEHGTTESDDTAFFDQLKLEAYRRAMVEPAVRAQRQFAERSGVVISGARYAGDPSNRQAIQEALAAADGSDMQVFGAWKDSDSNFLESHPVADVRAAYRAIGARRSALIALEALYVEQVANGESDIHDLDWTTAHD